MTRVFLTEHTPRIDSGHGLRTYAIARALAWDEPLEISYVVFGGDQPAHEYLVGDRFRLRAITPSRGPRRVLAYCRARAAGVPRGFARGVSPALMRAGKAAAARGSTVVADGPVVGAALLQAGVRPFVYCAHNVESSFRAAIGDRDLPAAPLRKFERRLLDAAEESWMASRRDIQLARELCPEASLRYVPNAIDVEAVEPVALEPATERCLFVASFDYRPNRDAMRFLVDDVMPRVWETLPAARLRLVGRGLSEAPSPDPRVEHLGYVEQLADAYRGCACALVPLLEGGGSPLKFVEALAYGLPVVATPRAAAGLEVEDGRDYVRAEGAGEFADAVVAVLSGRAGVGSAGRRAVEREHSVEAVRRALDGPPA
jgi:glycosyltransferase involved in cell wall biosynthesis